MSRQVLQIKNLELLEITGDKEIITNKLENSKYWKKFLQDNENIQHVKKLGSTLFSIITQSYNKRVLKLKDKNLIYGNYDIDNQPKYVADIKFMIKEECQFELEKKSFRIHYSNPEDYQFKDYDQVGKVSFIMKFYFLKQGIKKFNNINKNFVNQIDNGSVCWIFKAKLNQDQLKEVGKYIDLIIKIKGLQIPDTQIINQINTIRHTFDSSQKEVIIKNNNQPNNIIKNQQPVQQPIYNTFYVILEILNQSDQQNNNQFYISNQLQSNQNYLLVSLQWAQQNNNLDLNKPIIIQQKDKSNDQYHTSLIINIELLEDIKIDRNTQIMLVINLDMFKKFDFLKNGLLKAYDDDRSNLDINNIREFYITIKKESNDDENYYNNQDSQKQKIKEQKIVFEQQERMDQKFNEKIESKKQNQCTQVYNTKDLNKPTDQTIIQGQNQQTQVYNTKDLNKPTDQTIIQGQNQQTQIYNTKDLNKPTDQTIIQGQNQQTQVYNTKDLNNPTDQTIIQGQNQQLNLLQIASKSRLEFSVKNHY